MINHAAEIDGLNDLATRWGEEIQIAPENLGVAILLAAANGEFDELPEQNRLLVFDDTTLIFLPVLRSNYASNLRKMAADRGRDPNGMLAVYVRGGFFHVHRDAICSFADRRSFARPTWFAGRANEPNVSEAALKAFLDSTADGTKTEREIKKAASERFAGSRIPEILWRREWSLLGADQKRGRGRPQTKLNPADKSGGI